MIGFKILPQQHLPTSFHLSYPSSHERTISLYSIITTIELVAYLPTTNQTSTTRTTSTSRFFCCRGRPRQHCFKKDLLILSQPLYSYANVTYTKLSEFSWLALHSQNTNPFGMNLSFVHFS